MKTLPMSVATTTLAGDKMIIIKGRSGYLPMSPSFDVGGYNSRPLILADEAIIEIMTLGLMFGWDIPAVTDYEKS